MVLETCTNLQQSIVLVKIQDDPSVTSLSVEFQNRNQVVPLVDRKVAETKGQIRSSCIEVHVIQRADLTEIHRFHPVLSPFRSSEVIQRLRLVSPEGLSKT